MADELHVGGGEGGGGGGRGGVDEAKEGGVGGGEGGVGGMRVGREKKAVYRSLRWLKEQLIALHTAGITPPTAQQGEGGEPKTKRQRRMERAKVATAEGEEGKEGKKGGATEMDSTALSPASLSRPPYLIASIPPCGDADVRAMYMRELLAHQHLLDGYNIPWTPSVPSPPSSSPSLPAPVYPSPASVIAALPPAALRVSASYHPPTLSSLLSLVTAGVDVVSTSVAHHHTLQGRALSLHSPSISLHSPHHKLSPLPLHPHCRCYTCTHHTRAYLHHLLVVKEMLAHVLLDLHNWHVVGELFVEVRRVLAGGEEGGEEGGEGGGRGAGERWEEWREKMMARLMENERVEREEREAERKRMEEQRREDLQQQRPAPPPAQLSANDAAA